MNYKILQNDFFFPFIYFGIGVRNAYKTRKIWFQRHSTPVVKKAFMGIFPAFNP